MLDMSDVSKGVKTGNSIEKIFSEQIGSILFNKKMLKQDLFMQAEV